MRHIWIVIARRDTHLEDEDVSVVGGAVLIVTTSLLEETSHVAVKVGGVLIARVHDLVLDKSERVGPLEVRSLALFC